MSEIGIPPHLCLLDQKVWASIGFDLDLILELGWLGPDFVLDLCLRSGFIPTLPFYIFSFSFSYFFLHIMSSRYDATEELSGAEYLASIYGTEKDKVNCSFFFKIGACRHGDKCLRAHHRPTFSNTVLLKNFYHSPALAQPDAYDNLKLGKTDNLDQQHFDEFYEEVFTEMERKYGPVEELNICENIGEHMVGNVYVKFVYEKDAEKAVQGLENRWFNGHPIYAELSPVSDFREARCRQHEISTCVKGGFCNFMHLKDVSDDVYERCYGGKGARYRSGRRHDRFYADDGYDDRRDRDRSDRDRGDRDRGDRDRRRRRRDDDDDFHDYRR
uniref:Splicing factor U2af 38 kDa subunit n=3 Tax=Meloidogyne TaxID=189290 RepID=A0A914KVY7_MELIC